MRSAARRARDSDSVTIFARAAATSPFSFSSASLTMPPASACVFSTIDARNAAASRRKLVAHVGGGVTRGVQLLFHLRRRFVEARHRLFVDLVRGAHFALARLDHVD